MKWRDRLRVVLRRDQVGRELDEELAFHIDHLAAEKMAEGLSADEARSAALREFGMVAPIQEACRSARGLDWLEHLAQDLRLAWRNTLRRPAFAASVVALLAVGVAAATAVFSVVDRVLFRPLPYAREAQLVTLGIRIPWLEFDFLTAGSYAELRRERAPLAAVSSWSGVADCDLTEASGARLACARAESTFLPLLGVEPALGRNFTADEDRPGVPRVALVSYDFWRTRLGADRAALGRRLQVDGQPVQIVGVLPEGFELPTLDRADLLLPQALPVNVPPGARPLRVVGRLPEGMEAAGARTALVGRAQRMFTEIPPRLRTQVEFRVRGLREMQTGDFRTASWTLLAAVMAMLAIACANAANLLLARAVARRHELAIRVALGAGRARMVRQTLTETVALGLAGGLLGCALAQALLRAFVAIAPAGVPHLAAATLDARVLAFAFCAALASGVAAGLAPAWYTPGVETLNGARTVGTSSLAARRLLVGAQLAVSLVLLSSAAVLLQSLWNRQAVALGMRTQGVATAQFSLGTRYPGVAARGQFYDRLEERLRRLPGVEAVALSDSLPPGGVPRSQPVFALHGEGRNRLEEGTPGIAVWRAVTNDYFRTLGIPMLYGRAFTDEDRRPEARSVIVSAAFAQRLFGAANPVGRRLSRFPGTAANPEVWYTVVGVAADARNAGLTDHNDPEYYLARRRGTNVYDDAPAGSAVLVRGAVKAKALEAWLRAEMAALDPALPVEVRSFAAHVGQLAARPRFQAWLLALFAGVGLLLAAFGLYGLVTFLVVEREREFGVRLTLGATPTAIVRMILADVLRWTLGGLVVGLVGALVAAHALASLLFHVSPWHPAAYLAAAGLLLVLALAAALPPTRRAARLDPAATLRGE